MTLEEFLKALREGEAVTGDGGETYLKKGENGRLALSIRQRRTAVFRLTWMR